MQMTLMKVKLRMNRCNSQWVELVVDGGHRKGTQDITTSGPFRNTFSKKLMLLSKSSFTLFYNALLQSWRCRFQCVGWWKEAYLWGNWQGEEVSILHFKVHIFIFRNPQQFSAHFNLFTLQKISGTSICTIHEVEEGAEDRISTMKELNSKLELC